MTKIDDMPYGSKLSRRQFIGVSGAVCTTLAAAGLAGCSSPEASSSTSNAETASTEATSTPTASSSNTTYAVNSDAWIGEDVQIDESEIVDEITSDVVVVGCGVAGSVAACAALDSGATVSVVDKGVINHIGGPACSILNSKFQLDQGFDYYDPTQQLYELVRQSNYTANTSLLALWAYHSRSDSRWSSRHPALCKGFP